MGDNDIIKDCIYCDNNKPSEHFICELCGVGMCEECYDLMTEHDSHFHEICNSCDDKLYGKIMKILKNEPAYICEECISKISNN